MRGFLARCFARLRAECAHAAGEKRNQLLSGRHVLRRGAAGLAAAERIVLEQQPAIAKSRGKCGVVDAGQRVAQRLQAFALDAAEVSHHDRVGRIVTGQARDEANVVAPWRSAALAERDE